MTARYFATPDELRAWLAANHATARELVVGFYKRATGVPSLTWNESVDAALCFGWIDGVRRSVDAARYTIRFTPRRASSIWSAKNLARIGELAAAGLVMPAGSRALAARRADRTGVYSFEQRDDLALPRAHAARLRADRAAWADFSARPPWYRRAAIHWVVSAKRADTRERRFATLLADSAAGRRIKPLAVRDAPRTRGSKAKAKAKAKATRRGRAATRRRR